jgi:hypothetical protein
MRRAMSRRCLSPNSFLAASRRSASNSSTMRFAWLEVFPCGLCSLNAAFHNHVSQFIILDRQYHCMANLMPTFLREGLETNQRGSNQHEF